MRPTCFSTKLLLAATVGVVYSRDCRASLSVTTKYKCSDSTLHLQRMTSYQFSVAILGVDGTTIKLQNAEVSKT